MKKIHYLLISLFLMLNSLVVISSDQVEEIQCSYAFENPTINEIIIAEELYHEIIINGLATMAEPGHPCLPVKGSYIFIPQDSKVQSISVETNDPISLGKGFVIKPGSIPVPLSKKEEAQPPLPDDSIYSSNMIYPSDLYSQVGLYRCKGFDILVLTLNPVQYIPDTGEIFFYSSMKVTVEVSNHQSLGLKPRGLNRDIVDIKSKVDNPSMVPSDLFPADDTSMDSYDFLILTTDEFQDEFIPLKIAHENRGLKTNIMTLRDVGLLPDRVTPEDIREFITEQYQQNNIEYVLLGGDADVVPAKMLYVYGLDEEKWPYETMLPSDLYFACLDGSYNADGDDQWGEPTDGDDGGDVDLFAEVYVGRACVDTVNDVRNFVNKTISYLTISNSREYLNTFLMAGEYLGDYGVASWGGNYLDLLIDEATNDGYITNGIPSDRFQLDMLYDREEEWSYVDVIDAINRGVHVINHDGHSYYGYNMKMSNNHVYSFSNEDYFFAYSVGCMAGGFDDPDGYDCFAEHLTVKTNTGAFAAIMNARYGWFWSFSTDGDGTRFHREFWDAVFGEQTPIISKANQDSKEDNIFLLGRSCMRWTYYELNYFGDPTLSLRISEPPDKPEKISGPSSGKPDVSYEYSTSSTDSEENQIYYLFDWGDNEFSDWVGPYPSGQIVKASHSWDEEGDFEIRVKAKDEHGSESEWSDPLIISMPKNKPYQEFTLIQLLRQFIQNSFSYFMR